MAQSLNTEVEYTGEVVVHLGFPKYGKILIGDMAFEFFDDRNVESNMQFPWQSIKRVEGTVHKFFGGKNHKIGRAFAIVFQNGHKVRFASKDAGKVLKIIREHIGNDRVVKRQTFIGTFTNLAKRRNKKNKTGLKELK